MPEAAKDADLELEAKKEIERLKDIGKERSGEAKKDEHRMQPAKDALTAGEVARIGTGKNGVHIYCSEAKRLVVTLRSAQKNLTPDGRIYETAPEVARFEGQVFRTEDAGLAEQLEKHKAYGKKFWRLDDYKLRLAGKRKKQERELGLHKKLLGAELQGLVNADVGGIEQVGMDRRDGA